MNDNAGREASLATVRPPNLVQAGQLWVMESEDSEEPDEISFALLIQCSNADQVREAMRTGKINFTIFEHYSQNVESTHGPESSENQKP